MIHYCPVCGTDNEGSAGARITCRGCSAAFDAPSATQPPAPAPVAPPPPSTSGWAAGGMGSSSPAPMMGSSSGMSSYGQPASTNPLAIVSLVFGIVCCIPLVSPGVAITCGIIAMKQIDESGGAQKGKGLAIAGIILGGLTILMNVIGLIGNIAQRT